MGRAATIIGLGLSLEAGYAFLGAAPAHPVRMSGAVEDYRKAQCEQPGVKVGSTCHLLYLQGSSTEYRLLDAIDEDPNATAPTYTTNLYDDPPSKIGYTKLAAGVLGAFGVVAFITGIGMIVAPPGPD